MPKKMTPKKPRKLQGQKPKPRKDLTPPEDPKILHELDKLEDTFEKGEKVSRTSQLDPREVEEEIVPEVEQEVVPEGEEEEEPSECEQMFIDKGWTLEEAREMCESYDQDNIVVQLREKEKGAKREHLLASRFPNYPQERLDEILTQAYLLKKGDLLGDIIQLLLEALNIEIPESVKILIEEALLKAQERAKEEARKETYLIVEGGPR